MNSILLMIQYMYQFVRIQNYSK